MIIVGQSVVYWVLERKPKTKLIKMSSLIKSEILIL